MASFRSTRVVIDGEMRPTTVTVEDGSIVSLGEGIADLDFGDLVIMPGLVDSHVHVNQPGRTDWEGFVTATRAAVMGGCTTIVDMPLNSIPPTVTPAALAAKREAAAGGISCDVAFWGGFIGPMNDLEALVGLGVCGFKAFLCDSGVEEFPPVTVDQLSGAMRVMAGLGVPALIHAEDPARLIDVPDDVRSYQGFLASRPVESEVAAVVAVAELAADTGAATHILHVSSGDAATVVGSGPENLTGETCPHYLTFAAEEIPTGATEFKCAPPIRSSDHREALWAALESGALAMVVSDHSPSPSHLKMADTGAFSTAWGGISSLQLRLPVTWTGAVGRGFGPAVLAEWLCAAPARLAGLDDRKGAIAVGGDGDLVVWDPDGALVVDAAALAHRHSLTPYQGLTLRGTVVATFLRGEQVAGDGVVSSGRGRMLARR